MLRMQDFDKQVSVIAFGFQNEFIPAGDGTLVTLNAAEFTGSCELTNSILRRRCNCFKCCF